MGLRSLALALAFGSAAPQAAAVSLDVIWTYGSPGIVGLGTGTVEVAPGDFLGAEFYLDPAGAPGGVSAYTFNIVYGSPLDDELDVGGFGVAGGAPPFTIRTERIQILDYAQRLTGIDGRIPSGGYSGPPYRVASASFTVNSALRTDGVDVTFAFDRRDQGVFDASGARVPVSFRGGSVNLIPEPGPALLLGAGLAALGAAARRQRAR